MSQKILKPLVLLLLSYCFLASAYSVAAAENNLEQRLIVLEDKEAIRTLLLNYGRYVDARDWDNFVTLFATDGGTWNGGMGIAKGHSEIKNMMVNSIGTGNNIGKNGSGMSNLHLYSNEVIEVTGNTATALSKWVFMMTAESGGPDPVFIGHYVDALIKVNGVWKFQERVVHGDITRPTSLNGLNNSTE